MELTDEQVNELREVLFVKRGYTYHASPQTDALCDMALAHNAAKRQEPVEYGIDWGENGDGTCVTIVKKLPDGAIQIVASEYSPNVPPDLAAKLAEARELLDRIKRKGFSPSYQDAIDIDYFLAKDEMSTSIKASLEKSIQKWADAECEGDGELAYRNEYWPDSLTQRMAEAAYAVLMANDEGQRYAEAQK